MNEIPNKTKARLFLELASMGRAKEAFNSYIHPEFIHHNAYFKGDKETYLRAIEENFEQFPNKKYEELRSLEDGDLVAVHGKVTFSEDSQWSVIHIFRFKDGLIAESWEASQQALKDSPNQFGIF